MLLLRSIVLFIQHNIAANSNPILLMHAAIKYAVSVIRNLFQCHPSNGHHKNRRLTIIPKTGLKAK